ncbi:MAG TPA: M67 family metallopeptidase [Acidisarcina sp.]|nr:M67 family metallopeptidase [Acidisarcina sp.]
MTLKISSEHFEYLRRHGEETYPHECCGVLVGQAGDAGSRTVLDVIRCGNTREDSPRNRYQIDPRDLIRIQRESHMAGREIVGFYHSHPDHPAQWSVTDLAEAHWTECSYIITSVEQGEAALTNSFLLLGEEETKHFEEEEIQIESARSSGESRGEPRDEFREGN